MKNESWWLLGVVALGALAGFAVVGTKNEVAGDLILPLSVLTTSSTVAVTTPLEETSPPTTLATEQFAAFVVIAYPSTWETTSVDEVVSKLIDERFADITSEETPIGTDITRVRFQAGFEAAAQAIVNLLGLPAEALVRASAESENTPAWSSLDDQADIVVLLGPELQG